MPKEAWTGYGRFCPLARGLDVIGERWTLVILQELLHRPSRYTELQRRLPGISSNVLSTRLRRLEQAGVVERQLGEVGQGVRYVLTVLGRQLEEPLAALRQFGAHFLIDPTSDGEPDRHFDISYVENIKEMEPGTFELVVDGEPSTLRYESGRLSQLPGSSPEAELVVTTSREYMAQWAQGTVSWDDGRQQGSVSVEGPEESWPRFLTATGYNLRHDPIVGGSHKRSSV